MKVSITLILVLLILSSLNSSEILGQSSNLLWNQSKIIEYPNSKEYRLQIFSTYSITDGIYVYYASDDDITRENIIAFFNYNGESQFWNLGAAIAERSIHFMKYEDSMFLIQRNSYTKTEIFSLINGEWVSIGIQTTENGISEYMFDEESGIFYTLTYGEEVYSYDLVDKKSSKIITINPQLNVEEISIRKGFAKTKIIYGFFETTNITSPELYLWSFNLTSMTLQMDLIADFEPSIHFSLIFENSDDEMIGIIDKGDSFLFYKLYSNLTIISSEDARVENTGYEKIQLIRYKQKNWLFVVSGSERKIFYYQVKEDLTLGSRNSFAGTIFTNGIPIAVNSAFTPTVAYTTLDDGNVYIHLATIADFAYSFDFVSFISDETSIVPYIFGGLIITVLIVIIWIRRRKKKDLLDS